MEQIPSQQHSPHFVTIDSLDTPPRRCNSSWPNEETVSSAMGRNGVDLSYYGNSESAVIRGSLRSGVQSHRVASCHRYHRDPGCIAAASIGQRQAKSSKVDLHE